MRNLIVRTLALALFLVPLFVAAPAAEACTQMCVRVDPGSFCRRCEEVGSYTGVTCQNIGSCGCIFTQNNCSAAQEEPEWLAATLPMTSAEPMAPATSEEAPGVDLAAVLAE